MSIQEKRYELAFTSYRYKIRHFAKQNERNFPGFSLEDVEQELFEVLWNVVEHYDPNRGAKFNTLFWQCARNKMADLLKKAHAEKRKSEWFEFESALDEEAVGEVVAMMESGDWQNMERMNPEDWFLLREEVISRLPGRFQDGSLGRTA